MTRPRPGGTGATLALVLVRVNSRHALFRKVSRLSLPTRVFQISDPIFFGLPIVLNPVFMVPYVLSALLLTAGSCLVMAAHVTRRPFVNVPWTTPPIIGHHLVTGGDWRAAVWSVVSIGIAMAVRYPFGKAAERRRLDETAPRESRLHAARGCGTRRRTDFGAEMNNCSW
jgi:cellobiose PTS system EIIC component